MNKEEIEQAKDDLKFFDEGEYITRKMSKSKEILSQYIEQLENILDERFIYVVGARTVYGRLMQLPKELIIKDDLSLRNEINILINEKNKLENKVKEQNKGINGLLKLKQDVINKLNKTIDKANKIINDQEFRYIEEAIDEEWARRKLAQELLNLIEGENNAKI